MTPQAGVNGVLPASVLQKNGNAPPRGPKAAQPKLKLVLRRLPPGLTKTEFESAIGDDWKLGAGKVDWLVYKKGKISKDLAKPSRPSRVYLHVTSQSHVLTLGDHVRQITFTDAAKSNQDPALIGPPTLEFSPYHRMPGGRKKHDTRQGTIDQDQEFKDFLESLTNPINKPEKADDSQKEAKVTTTPLIEALREKKANKEKPQTKVTKHGRGETKEDSADRTEKKILSKPGKDAPAGSGDKGRRPTKAERAAKEAVKVLNKEASASKASVSSSAAEKSAPSTPSPAPERKRGNASIAKSMLQRDLGLGPAPTRRRGTKREVGAAASQPVRTQPEEAPAAKAKAKEAPAVPAVVAAAASEKATPASQKKTSRAERRAFKATLVDRTNSKNNGEEQKTQSKAAGMPAPTILKKPQSTPAPTPPKGPAASRAPPTEPAASRAAASQSQAKVESPAPSRPQPSAPASPGPAVTGRSAFLKHANPSQGITEPLIEEALKVFGAIEKVEIDKRKGFAYVEFADSAGLQKAIAGSPVKVAQGAVQVLEKKEKVVRNRPHPGPHGPPAPHAPHVHHGPPTGPARGRGGFAGRGRGGRGPRGGGHAAAGAGGEATSTPPTPASTPAVTSTPT